MSAKAMQQMGERVKALLPSDFGYAILVFPFNNPGVSNYISNARREDMVKMLRETADRLDNREDFKTPENNIY
nr:hypothetical protein [uncultured Draconibacterium sp.]